jgi:hypothetical protein
MGFAFFGLVCGCVGALAVLLVTAGLLRLAVSATNKLLGPGKAKAPSPSRASGAIPEWDWDDWDDEPLEPVKPWRGQGVIPEPGTFKCMAIMFATALVFVGGCVATGIVLEEVVGLRMWREESKLLVTILNLPVAFGTLTLLLTGTLPTNFWRAGLVAFVFGLVLLAFLLFIGAIVFVVGVVFR